MPTPRLIGNTAWREMRNPGPAINPEGFDTLTIERMGPASTMAAEVRKFPVGSGAPGYPQMRLRTITPTDEGVKGKIRLDYWGASTKKISNPVSTEYPTLIQQVSLQNDGGNSIDVTYYAKSVRVTWMHRDANPPSTTKYGSLAPKGAPLMIRTNPSDYTGNLNYRIITELTSFSPTRIAPYVYRVEEIWSRSLAPVKDPATDSAESGA